MNLFNLIGRRIIPTEIAVFALLSGAAMGYMGHMYPHILANEVHCIDLDCSYVQIVQLKFRNVQSKRINCAIYC